MEFSREVSPAGDADLQTADPSYFIGDEKIRGGKASKAAAS